jgi:hypothetical protein
MIVGFPKLPTWQNEAEYSHLHNSSLVIDVNINNSDIVKLPAGKKIC